MSEFKVSVEKISEIRPHPNADRLELAALEGKCLQFVVGKGQFAVNDLVVYFPVDSIIPPDAQEQLGLVGKLSGGNKNRVKTIKLRGEISQGLAAKIGDLRCFDGMTVATGIDYAPILRVVKYDPDATCGDNQFGSGYKRHRLPSTPTLPDAVKVYDLESAQNHNGIVERLMPVAVSITEKIEGSHFIATYDASGNFSVCTRRQTIVLEDTGTHKWISTAEKLGLKEKLAKMFKDTCAKEIITIRGEIIGPGIQGNYYARNDFDVLFFEIERDAVPFCPDVVMMLCSEHELNYVPIIAHDVTLGYWLNGRKVTEASNGQTALWQEHKLREGIVIRPILEMEHEHFGRVILKQRSPDYLAKGDM